MPATLQTPPRQKKTTEKLVTGEELMRHPEWGPCELIRGKVVKVCRTNTQHGCLTNEVAFRITRHARKKRLGKIVVGDAGIFLERNPDTVRGPDVYFIRAARLGGDALQPYYLEIPPDLCIEIVSPNDSWTELESKVAQYLRLGVRLIWVIDPKMRNARVYRSDGAIENIPVGGALSGEDVLPGFTLSLKELFAALQPE